MEILRTHDAAIRSKDFVAGAIFFCYNDYRTHVGDRGVGPLQQRVHGIVDVYGAQRPSYDLLRRESSPIESLTVQHQLNKFQLLLKVRRDLPMYTLRVTSCEAYSSAKAIFRLSDRWWTFRKPHPQRNDVGT